MTETKVTHTKGPWKMADRDSCGKYSPHGECDGGWFVEGPRSNHHGFISEADARLIAAAPDLLEALKAMLFAPATRGERRLMEITNAAIAKAEGQ